MNTGQSRKVALTAGAFAVAIGGALGALAVPAVAAPVHGGSAVLGKAFANTVKEKSADIALTVNESVSGQAIKITGSGAFDFASGDGTLTENIGLGAAGGTESISELLVGGKVYVELPAAERSVIGGKEYLAVSLGSGGASGASNPLGGSSPTQALQLLEAEAKSVTKVGPATVDGVSTTEYKAIVNPTQATNKLLKEEPPAIRKQLKQSLSGLSGLRRVPLTAYIDNQGRVVRVLETLNLSSGGSSGALAGVGSIKVTTSIDLTNYGVAVNVSAPPANEVSHKSLSSLGVGSSSGI